jgi:hypothetical protein
MLFDILLHRVPWSGDKIRLYQQRDNKPSVFIGEFWLKISSGNVLVLNNEHIPSYIRRDLPRWNNQHCCWEYWYGW